MCCLTPEECPGSPGAPGGPGGPGIPTAVNHTEGGGASVRLYIDVILDIWVCVYDVNSQRASQDSPGYDPPGGPGGPGGPGNPGWPS